MDTRQLVIASSLLAILLADTSRAYEEPLYSVERQEEGYEVRRYQPYVVAEYRTGAEFDRAGYEAFRPLADFIGGDNDGGTTIPMTAPVEQQSGMEIPMTAPVTQQANGDQGYTISFVMPADMTLATTPQPKDPRISLRQVPERLLAVREYRGGWSESRYRREEAALLDRLETAGYEPTGAPIFARYNSPFMIWFLRRNAVMVEISAKPPGS